MSSTNVASGSTSPATPSPPSTSWQKPWVVAIVAASKSASARGEPLAPHARPPSSVPVASSATTSSVGGGARQRAVERLLGADQPLAHALAQLAGRHAREGDEQQLVERRALGDVARGERGDRVRLAGARARLEHGHAGRQRPADVEGLVSAVGHRSTPPRAEQRRPTAAARSGRSAWSRSSSQPSPGSSGRGGSASSSSNVRTPPKHELVLGLVVLAWRSSSPTPTLAPRPCRRRARARGCGVGGRGHAGERQRLAHAAVVEVDERGELLERELARVRGRPRAARSARPSSRAGAATARPIVARLEGALRDARRSARASGPRPRAGGAAFTRE